MDENKPVAPVNPLDTNPMPSPVQPKNFVSSENSTPEPSSNKFIIWLVVGLVIIILLVGGIYLYLSKQQTATNVVPSLTPVVQENLDTSLNAIDLTNTDSDFVSIDKDLQQL